MSSPIRRIAGAAAAAILMTVSAFSSAQGRAEGSLIKEAWAGYLSSLPHPCSSVISVTIREVTRTAGGKPTPPERSIQVSGAHGSGGVVSCIPAIPFSGSIPDNSVYFSPDGTFASVDAVVPVRDGIFRTYSVPVRLTWTAAGAVEVASRSEKPSPESPHLLREEFQTWPATVDGQAVPPGNVLHVGSGFTSRGLRVTDQFLVRTGPPR